jgi:hypothetical protein
MIFYVICSNMHFVCYFYRISYKRGSKIRSRNAEHSWAIFLERERKKFVLGERRKHKKKSVLVCVPHDDFIGKPDWETHIIHLWLGECLTDDVNVVYFISEVVLYFVVLHFVLFILN